MIAAIMPCQGRAEQTVANVRRLLETAGFADWRLLCVADGDIDAYNALSEAAIGDSRLYTLYTQAGGYWKVLSSVTTDAPSHFINLANDLWACDNWLALALEEYRHAFAGGDGLLGFSGDGHAYHHSCHFLISRQLLTRYGGWPVWYSHNFGDAELCARAQADNLYAKSRHAWLEHCHPLRGLAPDDAVYQAGQATYRQDELLFVERRRLGWPSAS